MVHKDAVMMGSLPLTPGIIIAPGLMNRICKFLLSQVFLIVSSMQSVQKVLDSPLNATAHQENRCQRYQSH